MDELGTLKTHNISGVTVICWTISEHRYQVIQKCFEMQHSLVLVCMEMQNIFSLQQLCNFSETSNGWVGR